jgi:hypothetical protein
MACSRVNFYPPTKLQCVTSKTTVLTLAGCVNDLFLVGVIFSHKYICLYLSSHNVQSVQMFCVMTAHANMEQLVNRTEVNPESRNDTPYGRGGNPSYT